MKKYLSVDETSARRQLAEQNWTVIQEKIKQQIVPFEKLRSMLKTANCPVNPSEIGLDREQLLHAVHTAQLIRIRYTVLDLLYECGLLDDACNSLEKLFSVQ